MLRSGEKTRAELVKQIEEDEKQLQRYETKLKDVVRAYKSLNAEKEALQATVVALTGQITASDSAPDSSASTEKSADETSSDESKVFSPEERVEMMKKSLATLIAEKTRREAAFQADKKALLAENDSLRERIQKTADDTEVQAEKLERRMTSMSAKMKRIEEDRERELTDHGSVLAEMQQRYAKERANAAHMERQIAELYKKLQERDTSTSHCEEKVAQLTADLKTVSEEKEQWRLKAEKTPTVQMLESELQNLKAETQREINELRNRMTSTVNEGREARLHDLEERMHVMSAAMGDIERLRTEDQKFIEKLQQENEKLKAENYTTVQSLLRSDSESNIGNATELKQQISALALKLRNLDESTNFYEILNLDEPLQEQKRRYEQLQDEFERYKLKAQAVLRSRDIPVDFLDGTTGMPRISSLPTVIECAACASAEADLRHTRSIIASLHEKLQTLEIDHANAKREYDEKCSQLHQTIISMQTSHENSTMELRHKMQQRVAEMEAEMQKQRTRTLDILAEKEEELEVVKTILLSVRSQKTNHNDPMDPPQSNSGKKQHVKVRKARSRELPERASPIEERRKSSDCSRVSALGESRLSSDAESYSSIVDELRIDRSFTQIPAVSSSTEAKNIYYEQELAKKDRLITELRNAVHIAESNARDMQQTALTKDLLNYEMAEKLKEEVNVLEGKLKFYSGDANMEYLRNVFIQLLHCDSSSGKKHILKAIGTVLKLSANEMRTIDKRYV